MGIYKGVSMNNEAIDMAQRDIREQEIEKYEK